MRTVAAAALVVLAASPVAAETAISVGTACEVRFVRAPDEVRHVIESWLAAEPHCQSSIDLRVLPIAEGYYLLAQRPDGRIHERVVPDAQAAGVLVASWVADDWTAEPPPPPVAPPRPVIVDPFEGPENALGAKVSNDRIGSHWLALSGMVRAGGAGGFGMRLEVDLFKRGKWTLSTAAAASTSSEQIYYADGTPGLMHAEDLRAVAFVNRTSTYGRWELRGGLGFGVMRTSTGAMPENIDIYQPWPSDINSYSGVDEVSPVGELAVTVARRFGTNWSFTAGAVLSIMDQDLLTLDPGGWEPTMTAVRRDNELMFTTGLRYAL